MTWIEQGGAVAFFAFDVGYEVQLETLRHLLTSLPARPISRKKQTPEYLQYSKAPEVFDLGPAPAVFGPAGEIHATVYDFGAVSLSYRWPLTVSPDGQPLDLDQLPAISRQLSEAALEGSARQALQDLFQKIKPAITRPKVPALVEDYYVFILERLSEPLRAPELLASHRATLAQALRFDTEPLSLEQQEEALSKPISYYERDLVLIDWNTAIIVDTDYGDALNVLELSNVELLETRYIDAQLDERLEAYDALVEEKPLSWTLPFNSPHGKAIRELAELRIESSLLAERVNNALKLIGDLYLARIHSAASERFYMHEWDTAISAKLDIIANLYQLLTDRVSVSQAQTLELVIIALILIEIVLGMLRH